MEEASNQSNLGLYCETYNAYIEKNQVLDHLSPDREHKIKIILINVTHDYRENVLGRIHAITKTQLKLKQ